MSQGEDRGLDAVLQIKLHEDVADVGLDGLLADCQLVRYLAVALPAGDEVEYFAFARRYPIHTMTYNALAGGLLSGQHRFEGAPGKGSRF